MATSAVDGVFLDTNVLVYAMVAEAPFHQMARTAIEDLYDSGVELWVSRQVLREYLATLTRPQTFARPQPASVLAADVRHFQARLRVGDEGRAVTERLLALVEQFAVGGKQVHDANIVATMEVHGIRRLLTANPGDFTRFAHLITVQTLPATQVGP